MKKQKKPILSEKTKRIITYLAYIIFSIYTITLIIQEPSLVGRISYFLLLGGILGIVLWAEYLRILYQTMICALTMECDAEKAKRYYVSLQKKDFFKSYTRTLYIFDTLYYQDIGEPQSCIQLLEQHETIFRSSLDYLLIQNFTYFYSYHKLQNRSKVKKYYPEVIKMKGAKVKGSKVNPLYNWEYIDAIYLFTIKDYKKSLAAFKNVNHTYFNNRELAQYYSDFAKLYMELEDKKNAHKMLQKAKDVGKELTYGKEASTLLKQI